jgi:hypothetical protein
LSVECDMAEGVEPLVSFPVGDWTERRFLRGDSGRTSAAAVRPITLASLGR